MKRPLKQSIAILLTLCSLLALLVPAVSAAATAPLEPEMLADGVLFGDFGISQYYCISEVNGHDYLFVPILGTLFVFDLDTWEMVDVQYFESDKTRHSAFMDSKGIAWIYGASAELYRYDPIAKTMTLYSVPMSGYSKLYSPVEVEGKLYFGTYGPAAEAGASLVSFDPSTLEWESLAKLDSGAMYASAVTYHNGYFYAVAQMNKAKQQPQYVVKFDPVTQMIVEKFDIYNDGTKPYYSNSSYFDDIQVAGDIMFIGGNHQTTMLAIDISGDTMKFADDLKNMPVKGGIQRCISEEVDGKIYFVVGDHRESESTGTWRYWNNLYSYEIATKTFTQLTTEPMPGDIRSHQKSIVTIENAELGLNGKFVFTTDMALVDNKLTPVFTLYDILDGSRHPMPPLADAKVANRLTSLTLGPDGKTLYAGGYMMNTAVVFDITTNTVIKTLPTNSNQLDQNFFYDGKWYVTTYGGCNLSEIGADDTVTLLFSLNEGANKNYFFQERMHNFTAGDNKVFTSTVPHKSLLGGYIAWYDYDKKATYVLVEEDLVLYAKDEAKETWYNAKTNEPYTFSGTKHSGPIPDQMIKTLVYYDGLIYASTTNQGGSQSSPKAGETPKLIVYDPTNLEMVATIDILDGIEGLAYNMSAITGIVADPDVPGRFWGLVSGTLFNFTFDKETKTFNIQEVLSSTKANDNGASSAVWSPWKCQFDDGYLFYYNKHNMSVMMVSTEDPSYYAEIPANVGNRWALGADDNLYFTLDASIERFKTADLIAQIKAGKGAADQEAAAAVQAKIDAIGTVTLESEAAIKEARAAYDALSDTRKALVNAEALTAAEAKLAELKPSTPGDAAPSPVSPVLYIVIAVVALAAVTAVVVVVIRRKKKS